MTGPSIPAHPFRAFAFGEPAAAAATAVGAVAVILLVTATGDGPPPDTPVEKLGGWLLWGGTLLSLPGAMVALIAATMVMHARQWSSPHQAPVWVRPAMWGAVGLSLGVALVVVGFYYAFPYVASSAGL